MDFNKKVESNPALQQELKEAIFKAIEEIAKKEGSTVIDKLNSAYKNKPSAVQCVIITNSSFCITL